jgi:hypothetical protein
MKINIYAKMRLKGKRIAFKKDMNTDDLHFVTHTGMIGALRT